jgi:hypothetical protein
MADLHNRRSMQRAPWAQEKARAMRFYDAGADQIAIIFDSDGPSSLR